jgi:CheY-like chemotaxis protein
MKILVGDDDPILRRLMRELLVRNLGYEVIEAADGLEAWKILNSGLAPDLCIIDVMMPKMGGLDVITKLRGDRCLRSQKVILCSSTNDRATILQAGSLAVEGYLVKPFIGRNFITLVQKVCEAGRKPSLSPPLEPAETSLKRLGIGQELYLELVQDFTAHVKELLVMFSGWPAQGSQKELKLRLISARGAGLSLGAGPVVPAVRELESALASGDASALASGLETLTKENSRVIVAIGGTVEPIARPAKAAPAQETTPPEPLPAEPSDCPQPPEVNAVECATA